MSNQTGNFSDLLKVVCDKHISTLVFQFTSKISETTKVPQEELVETWNSLNPEYVVDIKEHNEKEAKEVKKKAGKSSKDKVEKAQCEYVLTRGNKNRCNNKVSDKSTTGKFCTRHLKMEESDDNEDSDKEKKETKKESKKDTKKSKENKEVKNDSKKKEVKEKKSSKPTTEDKQEFTFNPRHNKDLDVYVDKKSGFIFDKETKKIYGKVVDDEINKLSNEDIDFLKSNNIQYDIGLFDLRHIEEEGPDDEQDD